MSDLQRVRAFPSTGNARDFCDNHGLDFDGWRVKHMNGVAHLAQMVEGEWCFMSEAEYLNIVEGV